MFKYLQKLSTFRLLILFMLALGVIFYFFEIHPDPEPVQESDALVRSAHAAVTVELGKMFLIASAIGLGIEVAHHLYIHRGTGNERAARRKKAGHTKVRRKQGALHLLHDFLFNYRIANPDQERIDSELRVARQIQFSLVPNTFPSYSEWREFDLHALLVPATEVAGDYYDFFMLDSDRFVFTVGDVSGNGVPAALYMAVCRTAFRTLAWQFRDPGELVSRLNDLLVRDNQSGLYVTIACFIVHLPTGKCQYVLAGHPAPLWHHEKRGSAEIIDSPRETLAGLKAGITFPVGQIQLVPGDTILVYSDGVSDARNTAGEELGYQGVHERFTKCVGAANCESLIDRLKNAVNAYTTVRQQDDITILAFRYWGPGGQKMRRLRAAVTERESHAAEA